MCYLQENFSKGRHEKITEWRGQAGGVVENRMKINPSKSKVICFMRARIKVPLNYYLLGMLVLEASSCKYLGIILCSDLSWAYQVNYTVKKAWKALHFMRTLRKGTSNTKSSAYMTLVRPILEYGAACWDPYREAQIRELDRVQRKAAKFAHHIVAYPCADARYFVGVLCVLCIICGLWCTLTWCNL